MLGRTEVRRIDPEIQAIAEKTGLSELSIEYLIDEKDLSKDDDPSIAKLHQGYLDLANTLLGDYRSFFQTSKVYVDYLGAVDRIKDSMGIPEWEEVVEKFRVQLFSPETKYLYVLDSREKADYCLYLLGMRFSEMLRRDVDA